MALISVADALTRVLAGAAPTAPESVGLIGARGRVLAEDVVARLTQPPFNASAMDGYAVRGCELAKTPAAFKLIGESQAGLGFARRARRWRGRAHPHGRAAAGRRRHRRHPGDRRAQRRGRDRARGPEGRRQRAPGRKRLPRRANADQRRDQPRCGRHHALCCRRPWASHGAPQAGGRHPGDGR